MSKGVQFVRVNLLGPNGAGLPTVEHDVSDTPITGAMRPRAYTAFSDPSGRFTAGVWACDAGTLEIEDLEVDEACYLMQGEVILTDRSGHTERFVAGDGFVVPRGFVGTWHMPAPVLKYNAMYRRP